MRANWPFKKELLEKALGRESKIRWLLKITKVNLPLLEKAIAIEKKQKAAGKANKGETSKAFYHNAIASAFGTKPGKEGLASKYVIAYLGFHHKEDDDFPLEVDYIFTHPTYKNSGVATLLMSKLREHYPKLNILVQSTPDAVGFWLKQRRTYVAWNTGLSKTYSTLNDTA